MLREVELLVRLEELALPRQRRRERIGVSSFLLRTNRTKIVVSPAVGRDASQNAALAEITPQQPSNKPTLSPWEIYAVYDLERARFSAFAIELPGAMYVTVIGLVSALITDSVSLGPG
jgi:hypothetical protein